jgi:uncharacterized protein YcbX
MEPFVALVRVYPFKSLTGADVAAAGLTSGGGLVRDREFALYDETGCVNAKRDVAVHALHVTYDAEVTSAEFASSRIDGPFRFSFDDEPHALEAWLSRHFGRPIELRRNSAGGFPDDPRAPGPTIVSSATLATVAGWFPGLDAANVRARLRSNIEVGGVPAFWEDCLYAEAGRTVAFRVGEVALEGSNPCARCVVPSRDADSGEPLLEFAKRVSERRAATLPAWAERSRFDHFYRLAVNTLAAPSSRPGTIRVGDAVRVTTASLT